MEIISLEDLLKKATEEDASDIQVQRDKVFFRVGGTIRLTPYSLGSNYEIDVSLKDTYDYTLRKLVGEKRYNLRVNKHKVNGQWEFSLRILPYSPPPFNDLGLPKNLLNLTALADGLVLVTGATCSGKTTTTMSLVDAMVQNGGRTVITIEEPVEYILEAEGSCIKQREVGVDVSSFEEGINQALRQNPDIIVVGELRDTGSALATLQASNSGHLVFATIHSHGIKGAIEKFVGLIPGDRRIVLSNLSLSLRAVIDQRLYTEAGGGGKRKPLVRSLFITSIPVKNIIKGGDLSGLDDHIQSSDMY